MSGRKKRPIEFKDNISDAIPIKKKKTNPISTTDDRSISTITSTAQYDRITIQKPHKLLAVSSVYSITIQKPHVELPVRRTRTQKEFVFSNINSPKNEIVNENNSNLFNSKKSFDFGWPNNLNLISNLNSPEKSKEDQMMIIEESLKKLPDNLSEDYYNKLIQILEIKKNKSVPIAISTMATKSTTKSTKRKNITLKYTGCGVKDVLEKYGDKVVKFSETDDGVIVNLHYEVRQNTGKKLKNFQIQGAKVELREKSNNYFWIFSLDDANMGNSSEYANEEETEIETGIFSIKELLVGDLNLFCFMFKAALLKIETLIMNEDFMSAILLNELLLLATSIKSIKIIGFNAKMNEMILDTLVCFRIDLCFIWERTLVVIECKARLERGGGGLEGLQCIIFRQYTERLINFLRENNVKAGEFDQILEIGLGYGGETDKAVTVAVWGRGIKEIKPYNYRTNEFLAALREKKKRFSRLFPRKMERVAKIMIKKKKELEQIIIN
jgi:hypothetical protein